MSRSLSAEMQAVASAEVVRPFYLIDMEFSSPIRLWTGNGDLDAPNANNVITNGGFTGNLNGWTAVTFGTGTVTYSNNAAVLTAGAGFSNRVFINQSFDTIAGKKYAIKLNTSGIQLRVRVRNALTNADILPLTYYDAGTNTILFTATSTRTNLHLRNQNEGTVTIDHADVYETELYTGVGDLLAIGSVRESTDLNANGTTITLTGVKTSLVAIARDEDYQGEKATIKLGAMDETANVVTSPVTLFTGFMDTMTISDNGEKSTIQVTVENKLIAFARKYVRRYTDNDQRIDHPTDKGFEYVTSIQDTEIVWGKVTPETSTTRVITEPVRTNA